MKLGEVAKITQGIPLSRIRTRKGMEVDKRNVYSFEKNSKVIVPKNLKEADQNIPVVEEDMVLFNITSYNAKRANEEDIGKIVSSNYVMVTANEKYILPEYLAWYMEESESFKREVHKLKQGSFILSIPINDFRKINMKLPSFEIQEKIGQVYDLSKRRKRLFNEREDLISKSLIKIHEEVMING